MENESERIRLQIDGMHCDGCVRRVRKLLEMAGASAVHGVAVGSAEFSVTADGPPAKAFTQALEEAGFHAQVQR